MAEYRWAGRSYAVSADVVGQVAEEIEAKYGSCSAHRLVNAARPPESPVHRLFEGWWDDERAAEAHRVELARRVLRNLEIVTSVRTEPVIAFVPVAHVPNRDEGGYVSTLRAMSDESMATQVLRESLSQFMGLRRRYEHLTELSILKPLWAALDQVVEEASSRID